MENLIKFINPYSKTLLENEIKKNRKCATYIFYGRKGSFHLDLAIYFIKSLSASNVYSIIEPKKKDEIIKIEDIRNVINESYKSSFQGKNFFIINDISNLREESWNSLLKTLEEPINSIFILISRKENLPLTLKSRAILIDVSPIEFKDEKVYKFFNGNLEASFEFSNSKLEIEKVEAKSFEEAIEEYFKNKDIKNKAILIKSIEFFISNLHNLEKIKKVLIAEKLDKLGQKDKEFLKEIIEILIDKYSLSLKEDNIKKLLFLKEALLRNVNLSSLLISFFLYLK